MTSGIYGIVHTLSGRIYVGASRNIGVRWCQHWTQLLSGNHSNIALQLTFDSCPDDTFGLQQARSRCGDKRSEGRWGVTIHDALAAKLGRKPTNAELKAEMARIREEGIIEAAMTGKLAHQRRRRR
jgi:hypothetical protein